MVTTTTLLAIVLILDRCCNTCEEVKDAYRTKGWALPPLKDIEQCVNEGQLVESTDLPEEGCQIYGYLEVNRVSEVNANVVKVNMHSTAFVTVYLIFPLLSFIKSIECVCPVHPLECRFVCVTSPHCLIFYSEGLTNLVALFS